MIFNYAIFNGQLLPNTQAKISIFDDAFFSSFGVYESVKVDHGQPFYLKEHLERLIKSAHMLNLSLGVEPETLTAWFKTLVAVDPQATWSLRIVALGATSPNSNPIIAMQPLPLSTYPDKLYKNGATAILYQGQRFMPPCKSLNTLANYLARRQALQANALEGLLHHQGNLTEGARTNLFAVKQGQLITPPAADVLSGITRDLIVQIMQPGPHPVTETNLPTDLSLYDEVFISSTSMHVMPLTHIAGQSIANGQVGPITKEVMTRFKFHYQQVMLAPQTPPTR